VEKCNSFGMYSSLPYFNNIHSTEKEDITVCSTSISKGKAVPLHAMEALGGRGGIAPTHSRPRH
jgi:hypothetical protein